MLTDRYIDYLRFEKRYSAHTIAAYTTDLEEYSLYLRSQYSISSVLEVDHMIVRSWLMSLLDNKICPRSVKRKLSTLKSFYRFLLREQLLKVNPIIKVVAPNTSQKLPVFLSCENMDDLLHNVLFGDDYKGSRDKTIIILFYATGIRCSELVNLKIADIDLAEGKIKVLGKRNKERIIPIGKEITLYLKEYLTYRSKFVSVDNKIQANNNTALFLTPKGLATNSRMVYSIVHKYLTMIASNSKLSPHVLRHTFATHLLDDGADLNAIKEMLGHASLAATQVYTHTSIEKLKTIYKQAHPRA